MYVYPSSTQAIYNRPRITWIVGVAYFQYNQLVAVLDASLHVFQMTFDSSRTSRMGGDDDKMADFSELKETPALPQVKISSDLCAFCFHRSSKCQNLQKLLRKCVIIRYVFTVCLFIQKLCCSKGRKSGLLPITFIAFVVTYSPSDFRMVHYFLLLLIPVSRKFSILLTCGKGKVCLKQLLFSSVFLPFRKSYH